MKIAAGTTNNAKLEALKKAINNYPIFQNAQVVPVSTESGVSDQPKTLEETITGAKNRAKSAFEKDLADYGIGMELGIFKVPGTKSEYMDTGCCAIYDGKQFHLGLSSCFEYPMEMTRMVVEKNVSISQAAQAMNFSADGEIGKREGMIGLLTKNRVTRKDYHYQSIQMAMIHLENSSLYS